MTEIEAKKWGGSLGIIIPDEIVKREKIDAGDVIEIEVRRKSGLSEIFGICKGWKTSTDKLMREVDKGWDM